MIYFTQASPVLRVYAILLLFAAIILELFLLILTAHRTGRRYQFTANCMLFAAASILMCGLTAAHGHHGPSEILFTEVPYLFVLTAGIVFTIHAPAAIAMEIRRRRTALSPYSIKEAFDNLPDGVCFFSGNGIPVLCNRTMHRLAYAVTGRDIQHISELKTALEALPEQADAVRDGAVYCLSDGSVWHFTEAVTNGWTQVSASDVSELYTKRQEVLQDTKRLQEASRNLRRYANNVQDAVREQEILTMKMRIHEEIGSSLTVVERILVQNKPLTQADPVIARWKDNLWMLEKDDGQEAHKDYLTELCELCGSMNLRVITTGTFPEEPGAHYLLITAMRVCATNAVRHAGATELYADIRTGGESATAVITNNGTPPAGPPAEGGGLGNLRRRIEDVGGRMTVRADSGFELTATVPVAQEVYL